MSIELDICNSALIKLGATPIQSLEGTTKEAKLCKMQYPKIRDAALRSAPWNFAIVRATLNPIDNPDMAFIDGGEYVFALPQDCVRVWKIYKQKYVKFKVEQKRIIANTNQIDLFYISRGMPVDNYDSQFQETVANLLAADLCYALTQSASLKQGLEATADFWINQARSFNSQEGSVDDFEFDYFLDSRIGGRAFYT